MESCSQESRHFSDERFNKYKLELHGDDYFYKLDAYFKTIESSIMIPRHKTFIASSIAQSLEHPYFFNISNTEEFIQIKRRTELWDK